MPQQIGCLHAPLAPNAIALINWRMVSTSNDRFAPVRLISCAHEYVQRCTRSAVAELQFVGANSHGKYNLSLGSFCLRKCFRGKPHQRQTPRRVCINFFIPCRSRDEYFLNGAIRSQLSNEDARRCSRLRRAFSRRRGRLCFACFRRRRWIGE